mgnify:FL=1
MSNSALKQLHLEAKSRKGQGGGVPLALPKPQPQGGPRRHRSFTRKTPAQKAYAEKINEVARSAEDLLKSLGSAKADEICVELLGVCRHILQSPDNPKFSVIKKAGLLKKLEGARKPEKVLQAVGFVTRRGDDDGRQIDWLVLDVVNETMNAPSNLQKLERLKTYLDAERRKLSDAGESEASKRKREKDRQLLKFHDQHPMSGKKKKPLR